MTDSSSDQQRFEQSKLGQIVISILVVVFLFTGIVWNMPSSAIERVLKPPVTPVAQATGLTQGWFMFAPNPIRVIDSLEVNLTMADGTSKIWTFDPPGRGLDLQFSWEHWRNFAHFLINKPSVRGGYMQWIVRELTGPGERATHVELIRYREKILPPNVSGPRAVTTTKLWIEDLDR